MANTINAFDIGDIRSTNIVVCGVDLYNQTTTGGVAKTWNSVKSDADHIPCVLIFDARGNGHENIYRKEIL